MTVLLVDDENNTREALRNMLSELGHRTILEARNGLEALKLLDSEKSRVRMIVADWEMPYMDGLQLLAEVGQRPALDFAPFLLITSDLPRTRLAELQQGNPRLDSHLIKPFRLGALEKTLGEAFVHRTVSRSILLYCAPELPAALVEAFEKARKTGTQHWAELRAASGSIAEAVATAGRDLGALIFDPARFSAADAEWLTTYRKSPAGAAAPIACASRVPEEVFALRNVCQFFVDATTGAPAWEKLLTQMSSRALATWSIELLLLDLKPALQKGELERARKTARAMLALDPFNPEAHAALGEISEKLGDRGEAIRHQELAITTHPCLPRPYLRLLELLTEPGRRSELAGLACRFCPQSTDILVAAARAWRDIGDLKQARAATEKVLKLNPGHPAARELLASLPPSC